MAFEGSKEEDGFFFISPLFSLFSPPDVELFQPPRRKNNDDNNNAMSAATKKNSNDD